MGFTKYIYLFFRKKQGNSGEETMRQAVRKSQNTSSARLTISKNLERLPIEVTVELEVKLKI